MPWKVKKLVSVSAISTSMTEKIEEKIDRVFCIQYLVIFNDLIEILLYSKSKINVINQAFVY